MRIPQPEPPSPPFPKPDDPRRPPNLPPRPEPQPDGIPDPEPRPKPQAARRSALVLGGILQLLGACDRWSLILNSEGVLSITIVSDGERPDHRYRVRARQADGTIRMFEVPASGRLSSNALTAGRVELTLLPPEGCTVSEPNPRTLVVVDKAVIDVTFDVACI
jgi:hypothetical protein